MISWPPFTRQIAANSSRTRAFVLKQYPLSNKYSVLAPLIIQHTYAEPRFSGPCSSGYNFDKETFLFVNKDSYFKCLQQLLHRGTVKCVLKVVDYLNCQLLIHFLCGKLPNGKLLQVKIKPGCSFIFALLTVLHRYV